MEKVKTKLLIAASLILMVTSMGTCRLKQFDRPKQALVDTTLIASLESDNQLLQKQYKRNLAALKATNDSLLQRVQEKKQQLLTYRFKTLQLEGKLKEQLTAADSSGILPDSLTAIAGSYIEAQQAKDSACTETISGLENLVASKDSVCSTQEMMILNLNSAVMLKELKAQSLSTQLNLTTTELNKKKKQNKLMRGGICILTGIASSLLIMQAVK